MRAIPGVWSLVVFSLLAAVVVAIGYAGACLFSETQPAEGSAAMDGGKPASLPFVFPDQGEPIEERSNSIHATIDQLRAASVAQSRLADALIVLARLHVMRDRADKAQRLFEEARVLSSDSRPWQSREAEHRLRALSAQNVDERKLSRIASGHHREALRLWTNGGFSGAIGEAGRAVEFRRQLLASVERPSGRNSRRDAAVFVATADLAESLHLQGRLCLEHGDHYVEAEPLLSESRALFSRSLGEDHPQYANCLRSLAMVADDRGQFAAADALYEASLSIHRAASGELDVEFARTLARQARMHLTWWREYAWGKRFRTLQIREQLLGKDHPECAESLEDLGSNALALQDFSRAEELLRRALDIRIRYQGKDHPAIAETRSLLAQCLAASGDLAQSHVLHRQAIRAAEQARGSAHPLVGRYLTNLAGIMFVQWDHERGQRACRRALAIYDRLGLANNPDCLTTRTVLGRLHLEEFEIFGDVRSVPYHEAAAALDQAVAAYEQVPLAEGLPGFAEALLARANLCYWDDYRRMGRAEARQLALRALELMRTSGGELHPCYPDLFYTMGRWNLSQGRYAQAEPLFQRYAALIEQTYGTSLVEQRSAALLGLGGCYLHQGTCQQDVERLARQAAEMTEQLFLRNAAGQSDANRLCMASKRFNMLAPLLSSASEAGDAARLYRDVLLVRGATAACQIADRLAHDHPELLPRLQQLETARQRLTAVAFPAGEGDLLLDELARAADNKEDLEQELALAIRPYLEPEAPIEVSDVQRALPDGAVLIDFLQYERISPPSTRRGRLLHELHLVAFVLHQSGAPRYVPLGPAAPIEHAIFDWRTSLREDNANAISEQDAAAAIRRVIWNPLRPHLEAARVLLVAPDGPVCFLPFAAFPGEEPGTYLIEEYEIGYVPSGRQFLELHRSAGPMNRGLLAIGDVAYGDSPVVSTSSRGLLPDNANWTPLPGSRLEVEKIKEAFAQGSSGEPPLRVLAGPEANVPKTTAALQERWRYIHFAGHGFFADPRFNSVLFNRRGAREEQTEVTETALAVFSRHPLLLSGLVLAQERQPASAGDGILTAEEVGSLDLRGTDLVVLSACETGLGSTAGGEGVLGLQRAFLTAGARSTIASLWAVDDAATNLLMQRFYQNLWIERMSKRQALRQAQLYVLNHPEQIDDTSRWLVSRGIAAGSATRIRIHRPSAAERSQGAQSAERARPAAWAGFALYGDSQ